MSKFRTVKPESLKENPFRLIGSEWMLITAGGLSSFNTMTASWGCLGILWGKPVACCVIRPSRHTYKFMESSGIFSLSFFGRKYRKALEICGARSGRDTDKVRAAGLTPVTGPAGSVLFDEARLVLECRKVYFQDLDPSKFLDPEIHKAYPEGDHHRMYVGQILGCLKK
jgi:flavin reductase (DIM6/NTAB) family NADH-FMN oxidoreductase RutF